MTCPPTWYCPPPTPYSGTTLNPGTPPETYLICAVIGLVLAIFIIGGIGLLWAWLDPIERALRDPRRQR